MKIKKTIIGIIVITTLFFGVTGLVKAAEDLLVPEGKFNSLIGGELFTLLLEIKSIELRGDILSDKAFVNLKDFGIELKDQPRGRENPFLSI